MITMMMFAGIRYVFCTSCVPIIGLFIIVNFHGVHTGTIPRPSGKRTCASCWICVPTKIRTVYAKVRNYVILYCASFYVSVSKHLNTTFNRCLLLPPGTRSHVRHAGPFILREIGRELRR